MERISMIRNIWVIILIGLLISCSENREAFDEEITLPEQSENLRYLSVSITTPQVLANDEGDGDWKFEGTQTENNISKIRFYFFDEDGETVEVAGTGGQLTDSYVDISPELEQDPTPETTGDNIEWEALLTLEIDPEVPKTPTQLLAVVNPTNELERLGSLSLVELENQLMESLTDEVGNFIMTNSVYLIENENKETKVINTTPIVELYQSKDVALQKSIGIHVERLAVRVDIVAGEAITDESAKLKYNIELPFLFRPEGGSEEETIPIYVELKGWALTSSPKKSRLLKSIDKKWNNSQIFNNDFSWNHPEFFRSFWASNPGGIEEDPISNYCWFSYNDLIHKDQDGHLTYGCYDMETLTAYTMENANPSGAEEGKVFNPAYPTKLIVAAQLKDNTGKGLTIAEYDSKYYTEDGVKNLLADKLNICYENNENNVRKFTKVQPQDLTFVTAQEQSDNKIGPESSGTYYVYARIKEEVLVNKPIWWIYDEDSNGEITPVRKLNDVNAYIATVVLPVKIWNQGYTYYFADIPHVGNNPETAEYFGVVRNNYYNITIEGITGLGVPVYKPEETIYPSTVNNLKITVKNMAWRKVMQDIQAYW